MRGLKILLVSATVLMPVLAAAQSAPDTKPPVSPKAEALDPARCAPADTRETVGQGGPIDEHRSRDSDLSQRLAQSGGVICPPPAKDSEIYLPTPPGGATPVIPPPGTPGGDQSVQPK